MAAVPGPATRRAPFATASLAVFLVLAVPFVTYVEQQGYGATRADALLVLAAMAAIAATLGAVSTISPLAGVAVLAGALTFFADIQIEEPGLKRLGLLFVGLCAVLWIVRRHAASLVSLMMATMLAFALFTPRSQAVSSAPAPAAPADVPLLVHLVLDEHIGIDGMPRRLLPPGFVPRVESFFVDRGFRLFPRAYSQFDTTIPAISHLMNLATGEYDATLAAAGPGERTYRLTRNDYFSRLADTGYAITVHQPDYLDVCEGARVAACHTHNVRSLLALDHLDAPAWAKLPVVAGTYVNRSDAYTRAKARYRNVRLRLGRAGIPLPAWNWERGAATSVGTLPMFDQLASELSRARRGQAIFAHLLMPHYPYAFDESCATRPPAVWLTRVDPDEADVLAGTNNTRESRAVRYRLYAQQAICLQERLARLMDAIPPALRHDAILIVQGDHGSRISLVEPEAENAANLASSDYADHFSTLFAVRAPGVPAGTDTAAASVSCLLRGFVESEFRAPASSSACAGPHAVFLRRPGRPPESQPLPAFWAEGDAAAVAR